MADPIVDILLEKMQAALDARRECREEGDPVWPPGEVREAIDAYEEAASEFNDALATYIIATVKDLEVT